MKNKPSHRDSLPEHLLVAVDAEGRSDSAIRAMVPLARDLPARLSFVHAIGHPLLDWSLTESPSRVSSGDGILDNVGRALSQHVHRILAEGGLRVQVDGLVHVDLGRPSRVITERASEIGADCVVLGPHERRLGFDFGSTARAVLSHAKSVWIQPSDPRPIQRLLVPVDLSDASLFALKRAVAFAQRVGARIHALHCFDSAPILATPLAGYPDLGVVLPVEEIRAGQKTAFARAMSEFDWGGVAHEVSFVEGRPEDVILEVEDAHQLVVMSTHGRTGLSGALLGHVAYSVLRRTRVPVWAVRVT